MPPTLSRQIRRASGVALLVSLWLMPRTAWSQRLDPQLLLRWQTVPRTAPRPGPRGSYDVLAVEVLNVLRDGRLHYRRRDVARPGRERSVERQLSATALRALHSALEGLCALPPPPPRAERPGDVRVEVQWADLRGCSTSMSPEAWRRGPTRRIAAHLAGLIRRAERP